MMFSKTWRTSERKYGVLVERDVYIPMRDGIKIACKWRAFVLAYLVSQLHVNLCSIETIQTVPEIQIPCFAVVESSKPSI